MKEQTKTTRKKDKKKTTPEYSISHNNETSNVPSNDIQDPHIPTHIDNTDHGNPIDQINPVPTNTSNDNDNSVNDTNTNEITSENKNDGNNDDNSTEENECP